MIGRFFLLLIAPFLLYSSPQDLLKSANQLKLYEKNEWKALLHYNGSSNIEDNKFILSKTFSLQNELNTTINAMYDSPTKYPDINNHPQCKFPARLLFIAHETNSTMQDLPKVNCPDLATYIQKAPANKISLVYASENVKNPSSMMGHTFLKLSGTNHQGKEANHAVTFYTMIETLNPLLLIYQNLYSGMRGQFALQPYKNTIKQYTDVENRNVWEFQLALSDYKKQLIYYHMFELKDVESKYFLSSYNCSTIIYYALSLANPKIYDEHKLWITPLDTVKFAHKYNLIETSKLQPSNEWFHKMVQDNLDKSINDSNISIDISHYKSPNKIPNERQLSVGYSNIDKDKYVQLSFLPASHLLGDDNREYFGDSELKIGYLSVLLNNNSIKLDEFTLYGMKTYMPYDILTNDLSYQFEIGADREHIIKVDGGVGIDFELTKDFNIFAIANAGIGYNDSDDLHLFFNPQIGFSIYEILNMKTLAYYQPIFINLNKAYDKYILKQNIFIHKDYKIYFDIEKISGKKELNNYSVGVTRLF